MIKISSKILTIEYYIEGLSSLEIGKRHGISDTTVRAVVKKFMDENREDIYQMIGQRQIVNSPHPGKRTPYYYRESEIPDGLEDGKMFNYQILK